MNEKSPFFRAWFGDWRAYDTKTKLTYVGVNTQKIDATDMPRIGETNKDTGWKIEVSRNGIDETAHKNGVWSQAYHSLLSINEMLKNAVLLDTVVVNEPSKRLGKNAVFIHATYCPVEIEGNRGIAKLYISEEKSSEHKFYLTKIEMVSTDSRVLGKNAYAPNSSADTEIGIAQLYDIVKRMDPHISVIANLSAKYAFLSSFCP